MKKILTFLIIFLFPLLSYSNGVSLGATRIIYNSNIKQTNLVITNSDKQNSFLIQSWVSDNQGIKNNDFIVTPPLYILDANKENALRIMYTGAPLPEDRESLFWMNVKVIPSLQDELAKENTLQIAIQSRIKLFIVRVAYLLIMQNLRMKFLFLTKMVSLLRITLHLII